jgi:hypothetical protein
MKTVLDTAIPPDLRRLVRIAGVHWDQPAAVA